MEWLWLLATHPNAIRPILRETADILAAAAAVAADGDIDTAKVAGAVAASGANMEGAFVGVVHETEAESVTGSAELEQPPAAAAAGWSPQSAPAHADARLLRYGSAAGNPESSRGRSGRPVVYIDCERGRP